MLSVVLGWGCAHSLVLHVNTVTAIKKIALCLGGFSLDVMCSLQDWASTQCCSGLFPICVGSA